MQGKYSHSFLVMLQAVCSRTEGSFKETSRLSRTEVALGMNSDQCSHPQEGPSWHAWDCRLQGGGDPQVLHGPHHGDLTWEGRRKRALSKQGRAKGGEQRLLGVLTMSMEGFTTEKPGTEPVCCFFACLLCVVFLRDLEELLWGIYPLHLKHVAMWHLTRKHSGLWTRKPQSPDWGTVHGCG